MRELAREYIILLPLLLQLFGIVFYAYNDKHSSNKQKRLISGIVVCDTLLVIQNVADYVLSNKIMNPEMRALSSTFGYCIRPLIILLFCYFVDVNRKHILACVLVGVNAAIHITDVFIDKNLVFDITKENWFLRGELGFFSFVVSAILVVYLVLCTIREHRFNKKVLFAAIFIVGILVLAVVLDLSPFYFNCPVSYLTMAIISCTLYYLIWLHIEYEEMNRKSLMAEQRIKIMMSQIQPHFLYNTLSTIQALCLTNPDEAYEITGKFGKYLRQNLDSLEQPELIPFEKELEHTKIYADIEQVRFPNISVDYNIACSDFSVPALTVQPLVENAIRHGVRNREQGIITVCADETESGYVIIVSDNGVGFDVEKARKTGVHIGLSNVKERIETMCGGTFEINSVLDGGTTVTIAVPKRNG